MILLLLLIGATVAGAFGRRIAGGLGGTLTGLPGTQWQRLVWAAIMAAIAAVAGLWWPWALAYGASIWAGSCLCGYAFPGEGSSGAGGLSMGRDMSVIPHRLRTWSAWLHDVVRVLYHGLGGVAIATIGAAVLGLHWGWILAAGALCPAAYELGYHITLNVPRLGLGPNDAPPTGELIWGALIGAATVLTIVAP